VEQVEQVMEDTSEAIQMGDEIGEAMSNPIGAPVDETDLSRELEEMEAEMTEEELLEAPDVPKVKLAEKPEQVKSKPVVEKEESKKPVKAESKKAVVKDDEAAQMKELEALMGV